MFTETQYYERDELSRLLSKNDFSVAKIEDLSFRATLPYIIETQKYEVLIYGAGGRGYDALCWLKSNNIEPLYIVDADINKHNTRFFGIDVVYIDYLKHKITGKKIFAFVCTRAWNDFIQRHVIHKKLSTAGCEEIRNYATTVSEYRFWIPYYKLHSGDLLRLYDELFDIESKNALYEYICAVVYDDGYSGYMHSTCEKYVASDVFIWNDDEFIADCGTYNGDTIHNIVKTKRSFKKIYAIEACADTMKQAIEFSKYLPKETQEKIEFYNALLGGADNLDNILKNENVTLLKTDVEGADYDTLVGAENIIKMHMPVLAVSVYHKMEDLIQIPDFIRTVSSDYVFFLRKYYPSAMKYLKDELILYAVPKKRCLYL